MIKNDKYIYINNDIDIIVVLIYILISIMGMNIDE